MNRYSHQMPAWLQIFNKMISSYWTHWVLGFAAGYILAAVVAAPYWE